MTTTRSEMRRKFIAAVNRRYKKDHKMIGDKDSAEMENPWDDMASWEMRTLMAEIFDDAFPRSKP